MKKLYFAYGSNMSQSRLQSRVGKVVKVGVVRILGWKLTFDAGYEEFAFANLRKTNDMEDFVEGVVYELTPGQMKKLDRFEGAPNCYNRVIEKFGSRDLHMYIALDNSYVPSGPTVPTREYMNHLLVGCQQNGLDHTFKKLIKFIIDNKI